MKTTWKATGRCVQISPEFAIQALDMEGADEIARKCFGGLSVEEARSQLREVIGKQRVLACSLHRCEDDGTCTGEPLAE